METATIQTPEFERTQTTDPREAKLRDIKRSFDGLGASSGPLLRAPSYPVGNLHLLIELVILSLALAGKAFRTSKWLPGQDSVTTVEARSPLLFGGIGNQLQFLPSAPTFKHPLSFERIIF